MPRLFLIVIACATMAAASPAAQPQTPATPPPASVGHTLVYVDSLQMVVLVNAGLGGESGPAEAARTRVWGWTGTAWRLLDSSGPPVRNLAGVAYDSTRNRLVMHGGSFSREHSYGDTWEWTPGGPWQRVAGDGPGVRDHTQMAFDAARGRSVLFGGQANETTPLGDTWEFDGARWSRVSATGPIARVHHAMAWDAALKQTIVFGGVAPGQGDLGDTWGWNGVEWRMVANSTAPRTHARLVAHAGLSRLFAMGGMETGPLQVLALRNFTWSPVTTTPSPSARYLPSMAYDAKRAVIVLFGGGDPAGMTLFADTWEFDGTIWSKRAG